MRIAIISDIHGNLAALDAVVADLEHQRPDLVLHLGDLALIGPRPAAVVDRIRDLGWPGVLGNTDELLWEPALLARQERRAPKLRAWLHTLFDTLAPWAQAQLGADRIAWLCALPRQWRSHDLLAVHASPGDLWYAPMPTADDRTLLATYGGHGARLAVYGHIHRPFVRRLPGLTIANSGSVGMPYDGDWRASYLLIDDAVPSIRRVAYDLQRELSDLTTSTFPLASWLAAVQRQGRFSQPS
jgi:predicted phosphodiesterase